MLPAEVLPAAQAHLRRAFGSRLRGIVLYGSCARGQPGSGSDLDLLVLLTQPVRVGRDLDTIVNALYTLQLGVKA